MSGEVIGLFQPGDKACDWPITPRASVFDLEERFKAEGMQKELDFKTRGEAR